MAVSYMDVTVYLMDGNMKKFSLNGARHVMESAVGMYLDDDARKAVEGKTYKGVLTTQRKYETVEGFSGQRFDGNFDTDNGKVKFSLLITDPLTASLKWT